jgi:hypothetical protein
MNQIDGEEWWALWASRPPKWGRDIYAIAVYCKKDGQRRCMEAGSFLAFAADDDSTVETVIDWLKARRKDGYTFGFIKADYVKEIEKTKQSLLHPHTPRPLPPRLRRE